MWFRSSIERALTLLDESLRSPADVRVYLLLEELVLVAGDPWPTYAEMLALDNVEVGTWDAVFAGTFSWFSEATISQQWGGLEGNPVSWLNAEDDPKTPNWWFVLDHTTEEVRWLKFFSPGGTVGVGETLHFRPRIELLNPV